MTRLRTYDRLTADELDRVQGAKLTRLVDRLRTEPWYAERLGHLPQRLTREDIRRLPTTSKSDYITDQEEHPPFGRRLAVPESRVAMSHVTGGTSGLGRETHGLTWRDVEACGHLSGFAYQWAGLGYSEPAVFNIGMSNATGGNAMLRGIQSIGHVQTLIAHLGFKDRLRHLLTFPPVGMFGTPSAINGLATAAHELGIDLKESLPRLRFLLTAAEPYPVEWAMTMEEVWGARLHEDYGATQSASSISASTCERGAVVDGARGFMHLYEWSFLFEVLDPDSEEETPPGEFGELVITTLDKEASPVLRYRTRDRVRFLGRDACPCGRSAAVIECGSITRYDDMLKIKGQNVFPAQMEALLFSRPEVRELRGRIRIDERGRDDLLLEVALSPGTPEDLLTELALAFRNEFNIRPTIRAVDLTDLPVWSSPEAKARRFIDERFDQLAQVTPGSVSTSATRDDVREAGR